MIFHIPRVVEGFSARRTQIWFNLFVQPIDVSRQEHLILGLVVALGAGEIAVGGVRVDDVVHVTFATIEALVALLALELASSASGGSRLFFTSGSLLRLGLDLFRFVHVVRAHVVGLGFLRLESGAAHLAAVRSRISEHPTVEASVFGSHVILDGFHRDNHHATIVTLILLVFHIFFWVQL